jgi:hypothetical protein
MIAYTALVTSCDRHDLLRKTLTTFAVTCDQPPVETIIVEDSALGEPEWLRSINGLGKVRWISNGQRVGQLFSCDRLWSECKTDWAFWLEDDWHFTEHRYFGPSYEIMRDNPDILTVAVRTDWHHPLVPDPLGRPFKIAEPGWAGGWGGFTFNPGLRRRADYDRIGSYGSCGSYEAHGFQNELAFSQKYMALGFRIAALTPGHCHHIGGGRSKAVERLDQVGAGFPKLLIAIPACHNKSYGQWESGEHGWPYKDGIHVSGTGDPGIQAVRDTWAKDIAPFKNSIDLKFFYGEPHVSRSPEADEIFLANVPDDYEHLPHKTQAICRYAVDKDYDYVFKCDTDTAVDVDRLVREVLGRPFDYAGFVNTVNECSGGPGYFLSKRAARIVGNSGAPEHWAEDKHTAAVLARLDIYPKSLPGHRPGFSDHWIWKDGKFDPARLDEQYTVTLHAVQPDVMREWWAYKTLASRAALHSMCVIDPCDECVKNLQEN